MPEPLEKFTLDSEPESEEGTPEVGTRATEHQDYAAYITSEQHLIARAELNDLVRNLELPKTKAQLLGSRLQQWNLLEKDVKVSLHTNSQSNIANYFSIVDDLVYCKDVCQLMEEPQLQHALKQWRIFIDSSKDSLKAVLLHTVFARVI